MNGGVSHAESFDPKPEITRYAGKSISETPYADAQNPDRLKRREVAFNVELRQKLYPLQVGFRVNKVLCPRVPPVSPLFPQVVASCVCKVVIL